MKGLNALVWAFLGILLIFNLVRAEHDHGYEWTFEFAARTDR